MKSKILLVIAILFAINVIGQTTDRKWGVGLHGGSEQYTGDFGCGIFKFDQAFYGFGGISVARNITEHFDIEATASLGEIGHIENATNKFRYSMFQANINAKLNFFKEDAKLRPFIFAGIGYLNFSDINSDRELNNMQLPDFGLGLTFKVSPVVSVVIKETGIYSDFDGIENAVSGPKDGYVQHSIGIVFNLGKAKDTDGDGLADRKDLCPEIAGLEKFAGCPDTDGDSIQDSEDDCPNEKGLAQFKGCPDTDGDGIKDSEDKCPNVKGLIVFKGCPDTDNDGITDAEDDCPNIAGLEKFKGCPDTDGDGIKDSEDDCPRIKGVKSLGGCPDSDGDGIKDSEDKCPQVAGLRKNKGCPEVKEEVKKVLKKALHGIKFQSGKDIITKSSNSILDNVVSLLEINPSYKLKIEGHTDSSGYETKNLDLSKRRAAAVKNYLEKKGISGSRITTEGYGETKPVADNKTRKGRAENRRVELTIEF